MLQLTYNLFCISFCITLFFLYYIKMEGDKNEKNEMSMACIKDGGGERRV
jgi:hypothetical protein